MKRMVQHGAGDKLMKIIFRYFLFVVILFIAACSGNKDQTTEEDKTLPPPPVNVPQYIADSAYIYTKAQVDFGPRVPNSEAHRKCGDYLVAQLKQWCDTVVEQKAGITAHDGKVLQMRNIIGSFNPAAGNRILLSAHWDTRPWADQDTKDRDKAFDGANDGAASAAMLLEVARQLAAADIKTGIDIILFDLEDYGKSEIENSYCYGSQYWANNKHITGYQARFGILLDMAAGANATFTKEGTSMQYAPEIVDMVWKAAANAGYGNYFVQDQSAGIIDDHYYINKAGIRCIDIIHYEYTAPSHFWKHWHTHEDTMDKIDRNTMKAVGQTLLEVIFRNQ
jgi:glutaminyl-peptide cyclotransferase